MAARGAIAQAGGPVAVPNCWQYSGPCTGALSWTMDVVSAPLIRWSMRCLRTLCATWMTVVTRRTQIPDERTWATVIQRAMTAQPSVRLAHMTIQVVNTFNDGRHK